MRIAHLCLSNWYVDGWTYQENKLIREHVKAGHEVLVLATTEITDQAGRQNFAAVSTYLGDEGAKVSRLPYKVLPRKLAAKVRWHRGVLRQLREFRPDAMLFHGTCGFDIMTAARYARMNPDVLFYVDSHEDWHNSARTFLSRELLHKIFYKFCLRRALPQIRKILCYSLESMDFVEKMYGISRDRLEFFPLGGNIPGDEEYGEHRSKMRAEMMLSSEDLLYVQAGKQSKAKKLLQSIAAFIAHAGPRSRLVVAGSLDNEIEVEALDLIASDARISFAGWLDADRLTSLLCAADVYLQPGTQSVNFQHSLCCRCAPIVHNYPSHHPFVLTNGWMVENDTQLGPIIALAESSNISLMQEESLSIARRYLDYAIMAKRVLR